MRVAGPLLGTNRWLLPPGVEGREALGVVSDAVSDGGEISPVVVCGFTLCFKPGGRVGSSPRLLNMVFSSKSKLLSAVCARLMVLLDSSSWYC